MNDNIYRVALNGVKSIDTLDWKATEELHKTLGPLVLEKDQFESLCITLLNGDVITIYAPDWGNGTLEYRKAKGQS